MMENENGIDKKAEKRKKILDAAVHTFARKGFYNTKIAEIARDAGIADGTVYLYFKNKDAILITIFEETVAKIIENIRETLSLKRTPQEKIREFVRLHLETVEANPDLAAVMMLELRQSNRFIKEYAGTGLLDYLAVIGEIIREGQEANCFRRDIEVGIAKRMLFGALDEISTLWVLLAEKKYDMQKSAEQISSLFLQGLKP